MNFVDMGIFVVILLCTILGWHRGVIKSLVRLVGIVVIAIVAYQLKGLLANFLIDFMPFFNFGGVFKDVTAMNILLYNSISFVFIFVMLFCILNILINVAGIIDKILKATIILYLPDKLFGALVGIVEGVMYVFVILVALVQLPQTQSYVLDSAFASNVLNRAPIIRTVLADTTVIAEEINEASDNYDESNDFQDYHIEILQIMIKYGLISKDDAQSLIDNEKINLPYVEFN